MKKICPFDRWEIIKIRQWLNEYASLGYRLTSWGFFVRFEEESDFYGQYQIDMDNMGSLNPNEERREELEALGWKYITSIDGTRCHIYFHEDKKAAMPVNSEFTKYNRKKFRGIPGSGILLVLMATGTYLWEMYSKRSFWMVELTRTEPLELILYILGLLGLLFSSLKASGQERRIRQYLEEIEEAGVITPEGPVDYIGVSMPLKKIFGRLYWMIVLVSVIALSFYSKDYTEGFFVEKHYEYLQNMDEKYEYEHSWSSGWIHVSEKAQEQLFDQIVLRYTEYASYYGYSILKESKHSTHGHWRLITVEDERFDRLVITERILQEEKSEMVFLQKGEDIFYFRYWPDSKNPQMLEELLRIAAE